ncbi:GTP-binding protein BRASSINAZOLE INSENSITIVE PALE GREEN 2, chloroplastic isoform X1 [Olea europaea var. sylvestris]|uniref:GTP-binding protein BRASSINAZOLE INSENSITIVE PALE GREEN 2, chloroplastic isoform X1 n=1 Tax=Olea europaea var. sylvestris TaxID=158386 RepID=UPI000C1D7B78|nr:GTP-binding protein BRASSINAZOLE INSENSITIVE PALE GREEN 2, chloroplastic isoform X1 [Olea europaea var. sylvestris]
MIVRTLSLSKLRKLLSSSSLSTYTYRRPVYNFNPSLILVGSPTFSSSLQNPAKTLPLLFLTRYFSTQQLKNQSFTNITLSRDGNYDEAASDTIPVCPGCGIYMQDSDSKQPGFFVKPLPKSHRDKKIGKKGSFVDESEIPDILKRGLLNEIVEIEKPENPGIPDEVFDENSKTVKNLGSPDEKVNEKPIVCARCHSLRHYGLVKEPGAEILLPDFDFDHTVGRRLISITGARTVVLMVVDAVDFDGSFPKKVAELVSRTIDENSRSWKEGKSGNLPRVVLVVTKIDLLPSSLSPTRLEHWVRARAREGGSGKLTSVHLVSAVRDWGVKNLVDDVAGLAGPRGQVWAIGAQNAGKSTLLNAIGKCVGRKLTHLTEAPVPGTTLGIVRMEGVFPGNAKLFDTPGLLHPHQISTRLTREEQKLIHIGKELKPRTYRVKAGHSVHIGGLMRLDIEESSVDSIYVTVWASALLPLHMGKTENACKMLEDHFGRQLQPPLGEGRVEELGKWVKKEVSVSGSWWDSSCVDIAVAGLGWFAIGLKGEARLGVWTYDGVDVVVRNALLPQRSHKFEVAGFTVSEIVSKADRARNKQRKNEKKRKPIDSAVAYPTSSLTIDAES